MNINHVKRPSFGQRRLLVAAILAAISVTLSIAPTLAKDNKPGAENARREQIARFIHVPLPITGRTVEQTQRAVRRMIEQSQRSGTRLTLVVEFDTPKGKKDFGRGSVFGASHDLANFLSSDELNAVRTVAYLPNAVQGHAVLPILACQEIIMAKDATFGAAGIDEKTIAATQRSAYTEIAGRRRTLPVVIALGMLDPALEVLQVESEVDREYVTPDELANLKTKHATKAPVSIKRAGETLELSGVEARRLGFAKYLAADRRDVAKALELPATAVEDDPSLVGGWRAVRVDLRGPIRKVSVDQAIHTIEEQVRQGANFICLWIDSPGGSAVESIRLAQMLADLDPSKVRTVAYVPGEARSDAAIVAMMCDQVVVHRQTILGGSGARAFSDEDVQDMCSVIRKLFPQKGRSWSIAAAMIDPNLTVYRATRSGDVEYFCDAELAEQFEPAKWERGEAITTAHKPLQLDGQKAEEYQTANHVVESFAQFRQLYGLENDPTLIEPGWADLLIQAMASPSMAVLLLLIGGAALYIELQAPGIGVGAFTAAVCFLLFFWSRYLGGTAGWLEATLFLAGVACVLLEIFVIPGFGICGLGGGAMMLASIVLASQTFVWPHNEYQYDRFLTSLLTLLAAGAGMIFIAVLLRKWLPRSRFFSHLTLEPPAGDEAATIRRREALADFHALLGTRGTTTTQLTPGGKARFGDRLVDVMADGEVIACGATVEVIDVQGNHVLVREVG